MGHCSSNCGGWQWFAYICLCNYHSNELMYMLSTVNKATPLLFICKWHIPGRGGNKSIWELGTLTQKRFRMFPAQFGGNTRIIKVKDGDFLTVLGSQ